MVRDDDSTGIVLIGIVLISSVWIGSVLISKVIKQVMNDTGSFLIKVILLSALLSVLIKVGGPALPIQAPFTERLNGLVTAIVVLPSLVIGTVLLIGLKRAA